MKYLFISGSPRKGNTDYVLSRLSELVEGEKELILLRDKNIEHCVGCLTCHDKPECVTEDDMQEIYDKMLNSDVLVVGTPNYFDNVTGLLKDFVDRTHPFYKSGSLEGKKLVLTMVGGGDVGGVDGTEKYLGETMKGFVKYLKLDLVGSYCFKALHSKDLEQDPNSMKQIFEIAEKINNP